MELKLIVGRALPAATLLAAVAASPAQAATVNFDYNVSFGQTSPDGPSPWATAVFDDGGSPGSVTLTMTVSGSVGIADVTKIYFNLDSGLDPTSLTIAELGGTGPAANSISTGVDAFKADGDGLYDILIDMPPPGGDRFEAGESLSFEFTGIASLTADSFNYFSTPSGATGPFLSATKWQSTGGGPDSDWVGAVPVPAAVWLFGSGLLGLVAAARRKKPG